MRENIFLHRKTIFDAARTFDSCGSWNVWFLLDQFSLPAMACFRLFNHQQEVVLFIVTFNVVERLQIACWSEKRRSVTSVPFPLRSLSWSEYRGKKIVKLPRSVNSSHWRLSHSGKTNAYKTFRLNPNWEFDGAVVRADRLSHTSSTSSLPSAFSSACSCIAFYFSKRHSTNQQHLLSYCIAH